MFGRIIIFAIIVGLGYLCYTNPKLEDHQAFLLAEIQQTYPLPDEMHERLWKEVDYTNFFVCSFIKTTTGSTMVTTGFLNKIKLVDTEWVDKVKTKLATMENNYY